MRRLQEAAKRPSPGVSSRPEVNRSFRFPGPWSPQGLARAGMNPQPAPISDEQLRVVFDRSPNPMTVSALDGRWLWTNAAFSRMLGYERDELVGGSAPDVTHPDDSDEHHDFISGALTGGTQIQERETRFVCKDGSILRGTVLAELVRDEAGEPLYFVAHVQGVSDPLDTPGLLRDTERTLRSVIDNTPAMICVKGRDHRYKLVNREFEQAFGMSSNWIVGRSDTEILPPSTIADVHAKDMAVLDSGHSSEEEVTSLLSEQERTMLVTRYPLLDEDGAIHGVCIASTDITERRAEERHKRERLQCSELVYSALAHDRFVLHEQPIIELESMQPAMAELLIRMDAGGDSEDLLPPSMFLPSAERFGLVTEIDEWVVDRAIGLASRGARVAVNLSAKTVSSPAQVDRIEAAIIAHDTPAGNLTFEITETAVADNLDAARTFATRMHDLGSAIALDDFGVGHGSFTYLRRLPIDYLKIDIQFVRDLLVDEEDRQVVDAIIGVARQFDVKTIAEGVEDQATLEELRRMGVDCVQGYLTGRPAVLAQHRGSSLDS